MISRNEHNLQSLNARGGFKEEVIEHRFCAGRGIRGVKNISGNNQRIGAPGGDEVKQMLQKMMMFLRAVVSVERVSKMPVCRVYEFHWRISLFLCSDGRQSYGFGGYNE